MELAEPIERINKWLSDTYSIDIASGKPIWRVVWSEDQFEHRLTEYTDGGIALLIPEVRELPKYRQWIREKYVLEQLVAIPITSMRELPATKVSYEPLWVFEHHSTGQALPPLISVCKFVIDAVNAAKGHHSMRKYVDDEAKNPIESRENRINKLQEELFGNETDTGDALAYKEGVVVPNNYTKPQEVIS